MPLTPQQFTDLFQVLRRLQLLDTRQPEDQRMIVIMGHGYVELFISALIEEKCKKAGRIKENSKDFTHSGKLILLLEMGVLQEEEWQRLDWFRSLRNKCAHQPLYTIQKQDLLFAKRNEDKTPEGIYNAVIELLSDLWNAHASVLMPMFHISVK